MEEKLAHSRHFFKVLIPGFQKKLNLPPAFCKKLKEEKSEWAMLKSQKGKWKIKVCRNCEGVISFEFGWPQFVDNHNLCIGDFVVFEHFGGLNFNVLVFDSSGCEREFVVEYSNRENEKAVNPSCLPEKNNRKSEEESVISYDDNENPHFAKTMKIHDVHAMSIPINFVRSHNLSEKSSVILRDGRGKIWSAKLLINTTPTLHVRIGRGWHDFYTSNELKEGDVCVFYLVNPEEESTAIIIFDVKFKISHL